MTGNNSHNFAERTRQERSRAERYCLFLSMVLIDLNDLSRTAVDRRAAETIKPEVLCRDLELGLRASVRESDVVATLDRNRIGLLLMETSRSGLEVVRRRVDGFVRDYAKATLRLPFEPQLAIQDASFPEEPDRFSSLTGQLPR